MADRNNPLKILQIIQKQQLRGAEMFADQLSRQLLSRGHECLIVALYGEKPPFSFDSKVKRLNANLGKRFFDLGGWKSLSNIIKEFKPDVVQANASDTLKFSVFSKIVYRWKAPVIFRNANKMGDFIDTHPKKIFNQWLLNQCTGVVSVSRLCQADFQKTFKFKAENITTVEIGVNILEKVPELPLDVSRVANEAPLMVNVGALTPEKNHEGLLKIFSQVKSKIPNARLAIVGDGKLRGLLESRIRQMNLINQVFLLGFRRDALAWIHAADLFVLPSLIEGLPGVILESFMLKVPVVANHVGGVSEVVLNKQTGLLIDPDKPEKFVDACLSLLENKNMGESLVKNAYTLVKEKFSNEAIAMRFETFYKQLIQN